MESLYQISSSDEALDVLENTEVDVLNIMDGYFDPEVILVYDEDIDEVKNAIDVIEKYLRTLDANSECEDW